MGLFSRSTRPELPSTKEERAGEWTRDQVLRHWSSIPDGHKVMALIHSTDDQLRVLGWMIRDRSDRYLAILEAKRRRERPDLREKFEKALWEDGPEPTQEEFEEWVSFLQRSHGIRLSEDSVDRVYGEVFGPSY